MRPETMGMSIAVLGMLIPILAIVLGIGVAFWAIYWDHRQKRLQYEERRLMIERGMMPPALPEKRALGPEESLRRGTIMVFAGIGLAVAYFVLQTAPRSGPPAWLFGVSAALVGLTGVGYLVYARLARNRDA